MVISWSEADEAYLVSLPDREGIVMNPCIHGETYVEAVNIGEDVLEGLIASLMEEGEPLPKAKPVVSAAS